MGTVDLTYTGLAVGMLLMLIPFYFLWRFRTGLLSSALWGTVRMTVQLLLIGVYLRFLFQWDNEWVNVLWMAVMAVIASHTAVSRTALRREVLLLPVFTGFLATVLLVSLYFLAFVVRADDVFAARFFIPVAGVLFGNMLTVNIMAVNVYYSELQRGWPKADIPKWSGACRGRRFRWNRLRVRSPDGPCTSRSIRLASSGFG